MAICSTSQKKLEEELTCGVCLELYKKPKLLDCLHVFCEECIIQLTVQDQYGQHMIRCPICSESTFLPGDSVLGLPSALHIHHLCEATQAAPTSTDSDGAGEPSLPKKSTFLCPIHKDQELELYCDTCEELICVHCAATQPHNTHQKDPVSEVFDKHKNEITACLEPVETQLVTVSKTLEQLDTCCEQNTHQRAAIEFSIHENFEHLQLALGLRKSEILERLKLMSEQKMTKLSFERDENKRIRLQLESCVGFVKESLRRGNQQEIITMKNCMLDRMTQLSAKFIADPSSITELANMNPTISSLRDEMAHMQMGMESVLKDKSLPSQDIRGVEVCAETTLIVTKSSQYFHWKGYGLTLHFPDGCLPADVDECSITIMASLAGQYEFSKGSHLVSAVFWLRCEPRCKFTKAISVEIEHCALKENASKLSIVRSHCTQAKLPYVFYKLGGSFTRQSLSSYGYIEVYSFSGYAVTQDGSEEREYCAGLYYLEKTRLNPEIHFVIHWNTEAHLTHVQRQYGLKGAVAGPDISVNFEAEAISLDIPPGGAVVSGGWRMVQLTPLVVTKAQVDCFRPGRRIPCCQIQAIHPPSATDDQMPVLTHQVQLQGARQPFDSLTISFMPSSRNNLMTYANASLPSLKDLFRELSKVADRWEDVGIFLDIDIAPLEAIKANEANVYARLREMLKLWLKRVSPPPCWSAVIKAVDSLGNEALALELRQKYTQL